MQVIVTGMHRSGTSLVAHLISRMGIHMGKRFRDPDQWNTRGYFEDLDFVEFNRSMLQDAGGNWKHPPIRKDLDRVWLKHKSHLIHLIKQRDLEHRNWGFKDPRACLLLRYYLELMPQMWVVVSIRDLKETTASLEKREVEKKRDSVDWLTLMEEYQRCLLDVVVNENVYYHIVQYEGLVGDRSVRLQESYQLSRFLGMIYDERILSCVKLPQSGES